MDLKLLDLKGYVSSLGDWLLTSGLQIVLIVVLLFVVLKVAKTVINRLLQRLQKGRDEEYRKRTETLSSIVQLIAQIAIWGVGLIVILGEMGIQIGPILAAAGILGLAVGFGAQNIVQDVISGFFLLLEDQLRIGDVVQVGDKAGLVEKISLRMVLLRDLSGNLHFIRNGKIDIVTNMTKDYSRYVLDIGVAYKEDVDEVIGVIKQVDEELRNDPEFGQHILEPIEILGLDRFEDSAVIVRARTKTRPIQQWSVGRELNRRLKKRFDELGIEIPFPHRTLYIGEDKRGRAAPLRVVRPEEP
jgi:small conductance mechanosensitive channel